MRTTLRVHLDGLSITILSQRRSVLQSKVSSLYVLIRVYQVACRSLPWSAGVPSLNPTLGSTPRSICLYLRPPDRVPRPHATTAAMLCFPPSRHSIYA